MLSQAFTGLPLNYTLKEDNLVVIFSTEKKPAPDKTIKGKVTGPDNTILVGVSVLVAGSSLGTLTNAAGEYTLDVPDNAKTLEFSLVGYQEQKININGQSTINVSLKLSAVNLNEVVVTGYTNYNRSKSVSAATTIGGDKINDVPAATFEQALQGRVPGLSISSVSGQPGTSANVVLRG
nr:carboxypeptidase-like regulatory domain-containing protein [Paraflavitalea speifideiaquila]